MNFFDKCKKIHGDKYDYSHSVFINFKKKIKIFCNTCKRNFSQLPNNHLNKKQGCSYCYGNKKKTYEDFLKSANSNKYEYFKEDFDYKNVKIYCKSCNSIFRQNGYLHLKGHGCSSCSKNKKYSQDQIEKLFNDRHNNRYTYGEYKSLSKKISIFCPVHGEFLQRADHHLKGSNCPKCKMSSSEQVIYDLLTSRSIRFEFQKKFNNCKGLKKLLPFDFYLNDFNICIEFDGKYHYEDIFGGLNERKRLDHLKDTFCAENGIKLVRISYKCDLFKIIDSLFEI